MKRRQFIKGAALGLACATLPIPLPAPLYTHMASNVSIDLGSSAVPWASLYLESPVGTVIDIAPGDVVRPHINRERVSSVNSN